MHFSGWHTSPSFNAMLLTLDTLTSILPYLTLPYLTLPLLALPSFCFPTCISKVTTPNLILKCYTLHPGHPSVLARHPVFIINDLLFTLFIFSSSPFSSVYFIIGWLVSPFSHPIHHLFTVIVLFILFTFPFSLCLPADLLFGR